LIIEDLVSDTSVNENSLKDKHECNIWKLSCER